MDDGNKSGPRDRRKMGRARLDTTATVHLGSRAFVCATRNLSTKGIALTHKMAPPPTGSFLRLALRLPGASRPIDLDAVLVRTAPRSASTTLGLEFHQPLPSATAAIADYVADEACDRSGSASIPRLHRVRLQGRGASDAPDAPEAPAVQPGPDEETPADLDDRLQGLYERAVSRDVPCEPEPHGLWHRRSRHSDS